MRGCRVEIEKEKDEDGLKGVEMKKVLLICALCFSGWMRSYGQAYEIAQLLLNVEKLSQLNAILDDLRTSYRVLDHGYSAIRDISHGNFTLHKQFLDGLMEVSPVVRNYGKIAGIVDMQVKLVKEYKGAYGGFRQSGNFNVRELEYMAQVYENLVRLSLHNLDELLMVVTAGELRMSDDERLKAIDRIYASMEDKLLFLRHFNNESSVLDVQRAKEKENVGAMVQIYGSGM
jgi:hypothetical protein